MRLDIRGKHIIKTLQPERIPRLFVVSFVLALLAVVFMLPAAYADTSISRSYAADSKLALGSIVSLQSEESDKVTAATVSNANNILGAVVNDGHTQIKLTGSQDNQVQVATSGVVSVLVSDINGEIKEGDHITSSPISGVGMKATRNVKVVGVAQAGLTAEDGTTETYTDENGEEQSVLLGQVPVLVEVSYFYKQPEKTLIPPAIQNIANAVAGKNAKPLPIIISGAIFIVTLIAVGSIMFSMIRSSIISVGRNPMSQSAVYRNVLQLSALVVVILSVAVVSMYLVLSRF